MTLTLQERALLVKLFYQNGDSATEALRKFRSLKRLRKGPLSSQGLTNMITKFEATGTLGIQPGRGRKCVAAQVVDDVATQVEEDRSQTIGSTSVRRIAASVDQPRSTVHKILQKVLRYYPYKLSLLQQLLPADLDSRQTFALRFLARVELQDEWPWNILWTDEAHFHLEGAVNTHNCRIWAATNPHAFLQIPLHSSHVTVWCGFTATFSVGPFSSKSTAPQGL